MKKLKKFETFTTVKLSDLDNNLSAEYYNFKEKGIFPWVKKNGILHAVDIENTIPKDSIYMKFEDVEEYNEIAEQLIDLKAKQDEIIQRSHEMNKVRSRIIREKSKIVNDLSIKELEEENDKYIKLQNSYKLTPSEERRWKKISKRLN